MFNQFITLYHSTRAEDVCHYGWYKGEGLGLAAIPKRGVIVIMVAVSYI